jgi:hypothetical protein
MIRTLAALFVIAQFWCPMHPEQRSESRGACAICGMALVPMPPAVFATYPVDLRATPTVAGARLRLTVTHPATGAIVRKFAVVHERALHLFVVSDGGDFFVHEHPVQQPDGMFMVDLTLPRRGAYMAIGEFLPEGGTPQTFQQMFTTAGPPVRRPPPGLDAGPKVTDDVRVTMDAAKLTSGGTAPLTFRIEDATSGAAVTDLEPYLGAAAHLLMAGADLTEAIHGHPDAANGSVLTFTPVVPRPGRYMLWLQFQRRGQVSTLPFVIDVP